MLFAGLQDVPAALADLFAHLADGNPVAWTGVGIFLGVAALLGLLVLKTKRDLDREDAKLKKKRGGRA